MTNPRHETRAKADEETKYGLYAPALTMLKTRSINCRAASKLRVTCSLVRLASNSP